MKTIKTAEMDPATLTPWEREQVYNGLDVCVTHDVFASIKDQLDAHTSATYSFSKALQAPILEMRIRGVLVDLARRVEAVDFLTAQLHQLERQLSAIVQDGCGLATFNWRSHHDLQTLFYRVLGLRPIIRSGRPTTDRGAREKLSKNPLCTAICSHLNALADIGKRLSVLTTDIDRDGRIRTSYNIAGTSTGRLSSSLSEFGTGGNLQNVEESLRGVFIADPGYKFAKADAKSGESYCVGATEWNLFGDGRYLEAVESGDIHTNVARLVWPDLPWSGDTRGDKELAETPFYRGHTYRFMCKKLGHGSNYEGQPPTLAEQSKLPIPVVAEFQDKYFAAFPAHRQWQSDVDRRLRNDGFIVSLTGRKRWFFGRRNDPSTLREAIAYDPQCSLADIVNTAMLNIWRAGIAPIVMHDHDALTFMYRERDESRILPLLREHLVVPIPLASGRVLRIPYDIETGWNKAHYDPNHNPDGLKAWSGAADTRKRQPIRSVLDTIVTKLKAAS